MPTLFFPNTTTWKVSFWFLAILMPILMQPDAALAAQYSEISEEGLEDDKGHIEGQIIDEHTREPVGFATVFIPELQAGTTSHQDGSFMLYNIPPGVYNIQARFTGYETVEKTVQVAEGDTTQIVFEIRETVFRSPVVEIRRNRRAEEDRVQEADYALTGRDLRRRLSRTISETLGDEPGLAEQSMGPAPSRPVLRGLGGERLEILEDGGRTGDLSATAEDHALTIDPMTAEEIEVIRGPSSLIYSPNAMGGIINVIRDKVPMRRSQHHHGSVSSQGETVNLGLAGGFNVQGPLGENWAYNADGSVRNAHDITTPEGELENTGIRTYNTSLGVSRVEDWGTAGASGSFYQTGYGIPGDEELAGVHPDGVNIDMQRYYVDTRLRLESDRDNINRYDVSAQLSHYEHREWPVGRPDATAAAFGVLSNNIRGEIQHNGFFGGDEGVTGIWSELRYQNTGGGVFTPNTIQGGLAGYTYENYEWDRFSLNAAARFDSRYFYPTQSHQIVNVRLMQDRGQLDFDAEYDVTDRFMYDVSASVSLDYQITPSWEAGTVFLRSVRIPGIEELSQDGPHLGAYSFEVGNPGLDTERGYGIEFNTRYATDRSRIRMAVFRNQAQDFIFSSQIAERSPRHAPLPLYQFRGERVLMTGYEANYEFHIYGDFVTAGTISYVQGDIIPEGASVPLRVGSDDDFEHLPQMPPLNGNVSFEYRRSFMSIGSRMRFADSQDRTGRFEDPTEGYTVFDAFMELNTQRLGGYHTFSLTAQNITNTAYRNHLSRIRELIPEPGRNFQLLYRYYF